MIKILLFLLLIVPLFFIIGRDYDSHTEVVDLDDSSSLKVKIENSKRKYYEFFPHGPGLGGGDPKIQITIVGYGEPIEWNGEEDKPFIIAVEDGFLYLVVVSNLGHRQNKFVIYRYKDSWEEINYDLFPKKYAVKNLMLKESLGYVNGVKINENDVLRDLDVSDSTFSRSKTAHFWYALSSDDGDYVINNEEIHPDILSDFKTKFINQK